MTTIEKRPRAGVKILTMKRLRERIPYSATHIYRMVKQGLLPRQVKLSANRVGWIEDEIEEFLASKIAVRDSAVSGEGGLHGE